MKTPHEVSGEIELARLRTLRFLIAGLFCVFAVGIAATAVSVIYAPQSTTQRSE